MSTTLPYFHFGSGSWIDRGQHLTSSDILQHCVNQTPIEDVRDYELEDFEYVRMEVTEFLKHGVLELRSAVRMCSLDFTSCRMDAHEILDLATAIF